MKVFEPLYFWTVKKAEHPKAPWFLGGMSFAESSFFPIPVDVVLMPMSLAKPERWKFYALLAIVTSVLGGLFGYFVGSYFFSVATPWLQEVGKYEAVIYWRDQINLYGFWLVLLAGITPIPYKIFTIASGVAGMPLLAFIAGSVIGRGVRFVLVAWLAAKFGKAAEERLLKYFDLIGWTVVTLIGAYVLWRYLH